MPGVKEGRRFRASEGPKGDGAPIPAFQRLNASIGACPGLNPLTMLLLGIFHVAGDRRSCPDGKNGSGLVGLTPPALPPRSNEGAKPTFPQTPNLCPKATRRGFCDSILFSSHWSPSLADAPTAAWRMCAASSTSRSSNAAPPGGICRFSFFSPFSRVVQQLSS